MRGANRKPHRVSGHLSSRGRRHPRPDHVRDAAGTRRHHDDARSPGSVAAFKRPSVASRTRSTRRPMATRTSSWSPATDTQLWSRLHKQLWNKLHERELTEDEAIRALELPTVHELLETIGRGFSRNYPLPGMDAESTFETLIGSEANLAMLRALATYRPGPQRFSSWAWTVVRNQLKRVRAQYIEGIRSVSYDALPGGFEQIDPRAVATRIAETWSDEARRRFFGFLAEEEIASLPISNSAKQTAFQLYVEGRTPTMIAEGGFVIGKRGRRPVTSVSSITRFKAEFDVALEQHWQDLNKQGSLPPKTRLWELLNVPDRPAPLVLPEPVVQAGPVRVRRLADLTEDEIADLEARFPSFRR